MNEPEWIKMINYSQDIRLFSHLLNRRGKPENILTKDELDLLSILIITDEVITPVLIAKKMGVSKPLVSRLIEQLYTKSLLEKVSNPNDKRSYSLLITDSGRKYLNDIYTYYLEPIYHLKKNLSTKEFEQLIKLIKKTNNIFNGGIK